MASAIAGRGLVAVAPIARDEIVAIKGGHIVDTATLDSLPELLRDINLNEELTTDYALFDDYDGTMECRCGAGTCRGVIGGRDWQRPDLQRRYGNYFSSYPQRKIIGAVIPRRASLPS